MANPLATYLHDHLAGAKLAIELLTSMQERHKEEALGRFAGAMLEEVREDRDVLARFAEEQSGAGWHGLKEVGGWLAEKGSRMKVGDGGSTAFEVFEALEFLSLGVQGKLNLWRALEAAVPLETRVGKLDLKDLIARAETQYARLEERRLAWAPAALSAAKPD